MTHTHTHGRTFGRGIGPRRQHTTLTKKETDNPAPAGFEPAILASERPQTYALDRAATGIGLGVLCVMKQERRI
jgi:hypothetical protein